MATSDSGIFSALTDSLVDPQAAVAKGHSLTRQSRAAKQLRSAAERVRLAQADLDAKGRHTSAPTAERELQRALAAWFEISTVALGMGEGQ